MKSVMSTTSTSACTFAMADHKGVFLLSSAGWITKLSRAPGPSGAPRTLPGGLSPLTPYLAPPPLRQPPQCPPRLGTNEARAVRWLTAAAWANKLLACWKAPAYVVPGRTVPGTCAPARMNL